MTRPSSRDAQKIGDNAMTAALQILAARPLHEWQSFVSGLSPGLMPRFEMARVSLVSDRKDDSPTTLQHSQFIELHDDQITADGQRLADGTGPGSQFPSPSNAPCGFADMGMYPAAPLIDTCAP